MELVNNSINAQFICLDRKKIEGIIMQPGKNEITEEQLKLAKKDKWFKWLIETELFVIDALEKEAKPAVKKKTGKKEKTTVEVTKK